MQRINQNSRFAHQNKIIERMDGSSPSITFAPSVLNNLAPSNTFAPSVLNNLAPSNTFAPSVLNNLAPSNTFAPSVLDNFAPSSTFSPSELDNLEPSASNLANESLGLSGKCESHTINSPTLPSGCECVDNKEWLSSTKMFGEYTCR
jgi:hypothetical protein